VDSRLRGNDSTDAGVVIPAQAGIHHFRDLGILDTRIGLILVNLSIVTPFAIWMIKGFIDGIPRDTEEAALVDGSSRLQVIRNIVFPMAAPGIVTAAIFCFIIAWNDFLFALILNDPRNLFVAGFIGSPAMNLIEGATDGGRFVTEGASIAGVGGGTRDGVVLGVRPEDLSIAEPGAGSFDAEVYASELTGESVLVTVEVAGRRIAAKADRHTRKAIGETVGIRVDPAHTYLFDAASGDRIAR